MENDPKQYHEPPKIHHNTETGAVRDEDNVYNAVGGPDDETLGSTESELNPDDAITSSTEEKEGDVDEISTES